MSMPDRILLVSPASPFNPQSGAQQRTALLYEALRTLGEVDVVLLEPTADSSRLDIPPKQGIQAQGRWHQHPFGIGKFKPDNTQKQTHKTTKKNHEHKKQNNSRYLN